jgi:proteasome activator subunit 4
LLPWFLIIPILNANMDLQNLANLTIDDDHNGPLAEGADRYIKKLKAYATSLPYSIESNSKMQEMLDFILLRICQSVEGKDFDPGFLQYDYMIT